MAGTSLLLAVSAVVVRDCRYSVVTSTTIVVYRPHTPIAHFNVRPRWFSQGRFGSLINAISKKAITGLSEKHRNIPDQLQTFITVLLMITQDTTDTEYPILTKPTERPLSFPPKALQLAIWKIMTVPPKLAAARWTIRAYTTGM